MKRPRRRIALCAVMAAACLLPAGSQAAGEARSSAAPDGRKLSLKAIGLSLLVPGVAQIRMGEKNRGIAFLVADAGFWSSFAAFRVQGSIRKDSYVTLAGIGAGIQKPEGRTEEYYRRIGDWYSSEYYDQTVRAEARDLYGDDLAGREAYYEAHKVPPDQAWRWESTAAWSRYRKKRNDTSSSYRWSRNMLGLAAANRVAALIDAAVLANRAGRRTTVHMDVTPGETPASAELRLSYLFP